MLRFHCHYKILCFDDFASENDNLNVHKQKGTCKSQYSVGNSVLSREVQYFLLYVSIVVLSGRVTKPSISYNKLLFLFEGGQVYAVCDSSVMN